MAYHSSGIRGCPETSKILELTNILSIISQTKVLPPHIYIHIYRYIPELKELGNARFAAV